MALRQRNGKPHAAQKRWITAQGMWNARDGEHYNKAEASTTGRFLLECGQHSLHISIRVDFAVPVQCLTQYKGKQLSAGLAASLAPQL